MYLKYTVKLKRLTVNAWQKHLVSVWIALNLAFIFCVYVFSHFFSYVWTIKSHEFTVQGTKNTVHALFTGPIALFTHLKIILLQCFQFSVFSFSKNKLYPNGPLESYPQTKDKSQALHRNHTNPYATHPRELRTIPNTNGDIIVFGRTLSETQKIE